MAARTEQPLLTVIIPAYNVAPWVGACLDSVRGQTYRNLEILVTDDGSTDGTGDVCDAYAAKDPRIRVIHQANGGPSRARNAALAVMTGDWVTFVDGDDLVPPEAFERLYRCAEENRADLVIARDIKFYGAPPAAGGGTDGTEILTAEETLRRVFYRQLPCYVWGKMYRRKVLGDLRFPEGILFEDIWLLPRLIERAERAAVLDRELYLYRQLENSIVHGQMSREKAVQLEVMESLIRHFGDRSPAVAAALQSRKFMCCANLEGDLFGAEKTADPAVAARIHQGVRETRGSALRDSGNRPVTRFYALTALPGPKVLGFTVWLRNRFQHGRIRSGV